MNNISIEVHNPDDVVLTLTASAKLKEWKEILAELKSSASRASEFTGGTSFMSVIDEMIEKASQRFYPDYKQP